MKRPRVIAVGEGMVELSQDGADRWRLGFGGDVLNTAVHLARCGLDVAFASTIGTDPFSERLLHSWQREGIDCSLVLTDPEREAGLYAISLDEHGERSFTYWRGQSAARRMFELPESASFIAGLGECEALYFSLITLAILPPEGRARLLDVARAVRARGGLVAFDSNYRPRLWTSREEAIAAREAAISVADIGLPTLEDDCVLSDAETAKEVTAHWQSLGCLECLVKLGGAGCSLPDGTLLAPEVPLAPLDTSGAGDAFNAGYIAQRLAGASAVQAAVFAHRLAGWTIMRRGATPAIDEQYPAFRC